MNEDRASRYHRLKRRIDVVSLAWSGLLLSGLVGTGGAISLRHLATLAAASFAPPTIQPTAVVVLYVAILMAANEVGSLPLSLYGGFFIERRYGLSKQTVRTWLIDQLKAWTVGVVLGSLAAGVLYAFIRRSDSGWWLPAGIVFAACIVGLANLAPVVLLPLFYSVRPLDRETLQNKLIALAERAGARVLGVFEWGLGAKTSKANAALTGLGRTRRILVSDTMLAEYSDEEIEVVLAHELAHHVHGDIWKGLFFESALILVGFFAASRALGLAVRLMGLDGPSDVAGLPVLLLVAGAVSLVTLPAAHAMSRAYERRADRFALELTRNPTAFISAMRRLALQNLAEEQPSKVVQWLFYSHPPIRERIASAEQFRA